MTRNIILIDASSTSITVSWPTDNESSTRCKQYVLQYRSASEEEFVTLSDKLTSNQAKKKNLEASKSPYYFRVRIKDSDDPWCTHNKAFCLLSEEEEEKRMKSIEISSMQGNNSILLHWDEPPYDSVSCYEIQMRESSNSGCDWQTITSSLCGTSVKKKNLLPSSSYQFRIRPIMKNAETSSFLPFSPPSDSVSPRPLSLPMERLFANLSSKELIQPNSLSTIHIHKAFVNKVVLLYASAHWCPPCRQFTPQLARFYAQYSDSIEIVFLSCDHDESDFTKYFNTMPWKAIPYDEPIREELMQKIQVSGIPRLVVLNSVTGGILVNNAVGGDMNVEKWKRGQK